MSISVEIVLPVLNEAIDLPPNTKRLHNFLSANLNCYDWRILIADNGSTDSTLEIAEELSETFHNVNYISLPARGRGRAQRKAWMESDAEVLAYMDVDLSADLNTLPTLLKSIASNKYDIAIGSRLMNGSKVIGRPIHREIISRGYSLLVRSMFPNKLSLLDIIDYQCGFKAISRQAAKDLVPLIIDNGWFFDSELLILAKKNAYRVKEIPIKWTDDPDTRVKIVRTAYEDIKGILRLRFGGLRKASAILNQSKTNGSP